MKLKHSNCDKTQNCDETLKKKTKIVMKLKN